MSDVIHQATVTGTVEKRYSTHPKAADCICCDGPHCYSVELKMDPKPEPLDRGGNWDDWVWFHAYPAPNGARVTITITVEQP